MDKDTIYEIIEKYDEDGDIDECCGEIESVMKSCEKVKKFEIFTDTDVFDSCGLGIYYISVSWVNENDELILCGSRLTRC